MKMNPPARSSRPISRKKPRIMRHLDICRPEGPSANTGGSPEIQPHQHLTHPFPPPYRPFREAESVDGAELALYKTPNGGGRNPAAAVLCAAPLSGAFWLPYMAPSRTA